MLIFMQICSTIIYICTHLCDMVDETHLHMNCKGVKQGHAEWGCAPQCHTVGTWHGCSRLRIAALNALQECKTWTL